MKKSKFTEQQIAFALQQAEGGTPVESRGLAQARRQPGKILPMEEDLRWADAIGGTQAPPIGGGECADVPARFQKSAGAAWADVIKVSFMLVKLCEAAHATANPLAFSLGCDIDKDSRSAPSSMVAQALGCRESRAGRKNKI